VLVWCFVCRCASQTGEELLTLEGHRNVVYAIAFNNPYGDKVITGSFGAFSPCGLEELPRKVM